MERFSKIRTLKVLCFSRVEKRERAHTTIERDKREKQREQCVRLRASFFLKCVGRERERGEKRERKAFSELIIRKD